MKVNFDLATRMELGVTKLTAFPWHSFTGLHELIPRIAFVCMRLYSLSWLLINCIYNKMYNYGHNLQFYGHELQPTHIQVSQWIDNMHIRLGDRDPEWLSQLLSPL